MVLYILAKKGLAAENDEPEQEEPEQEVTETTEKEQEEEPTAPNTDEIEQEPETPAPVQTASAETQQRSAIFMDINDESFVYVANTVDGVEYAMYAPDLMVIDGGIMENMNTDDLRFAASQVIGTEQKNLAEIRDTELFSELSELEYEDDVPARLAELKADALNNMPESIETPESVFPAEVEEEAAVFMDIRDETFVSVMQVNEGIEYTVYASDLTPIDGGVWEMDEAMELSDAVAQLSGSEISNYVEINDYDMFFEIADMNTELDVPAELAKLKAAAFESISQQNDASVQEETIEAAERAVFMDSFPYIATWTNGKTLEQLQKVLQEIQTAAKTIISGVESELLKMQKWELSVEDIIADDDLNNIQKAELIIEHGIDDGLVYDTTEIDAIKAFAADHEDFEETVKLIADTEAIINQRMNYGYDFSYMTPLGSKEAALDAFDRGEAVYLLYPDNSEGMALERYEIENFDGFFGIEKEEDQNRTKADTEGLATVSKAVALEMWDKDLDVYINGEVALSRDEIEAAGRSDSFAVPDYQYAAQLEFDAPVSENNTKKEEKMPNYQQSYAAKPKNPNILGNTPYEALGGKNDLQYYPNLKNRHADNIAKQLEADGVRFSGVRKGFTTTITINKRDIPRYEEAVTKVKAMYSQLNGRSESSAPYQRQPVGYSAPAPQYDAPARPQQGRFVSDNPDIIGNTDYRALGKRTELAYYSLNPRHADNVAKQLDSDGVQFSGLKGSDDTTITIRKTDIPRYEAAVEKVKAMYDQQKGQRTRPAQSEQRYDAPPAAEDYGYPKPPPPPEYSAPPPSYEEYGAPPPEYVPPQYEHESPAAVHSAPEKPKNPNVIGNTPYEQLGDRSELQYYPKLKNRHAENVAKQLDADGIRFSGLKSGSTTTITINKADIPRYEAAVAKVKAGYEQTKAEQIASSPAAKEAAKPVIPETRPEAPATFKDVPICTMSYMAAKQSSREQEWRNSLRASKACIKYINENLSARYAAHDIGSVVKDLEEQFGLKRALYTIAATIQLKDQDGRFSQAVKDKARDYPFDSDRARLEFLTEAHPVMLCFLYEKLMDREKELQMPAPEIEEPKLSALFEDKFLLPMEQVEIRDDYRGIPETKYYNTSANEYYVEGMGWLENAEYDAAQRESGERPQDFYKKVTSVNVTYVTTTGEVGEMDISPEEYRLFQDATYSEQKKQAYEAAKAALDERKRENNIEPLPTEMYSVSQTVKRKYEIEALCADGRVATVKSGIASIPEAKKALMEIFSERKGKARCEFIHPQVLWNKSRPMQWDAPEHAPDVEYMIKQTKGSKPAHSHYLQRLVKDETGAYQNDKVVLRGSFGECNAALAEIMKNPPAEDQCKSVTFEIYQLREDLPERRDISFEPYANLEQRGITPEIGMYQKMYVASGDILPAHGAGMGQFLEAVYQKFNIERPEDFKGHSLSISDVVVVGGDAYYVDKAGFKPLHEFMTGGRDMQRGEVAEQHKQDERREEPQQDKPDAPEKTAEHRKKKTR